MLSMNVVFTQILVILLYVLIGYVAGKSGLISPDQRKYLTRICSNLIMPFTVLSAASQAITRRQMADLGLAAVLFFCLYVLTAVLALRIQAVRGTPVPLKVTTTSLVTYPNATFLGLPLCRALFGDMAVLYNAMALVVFNVLFFTWQCSMFTGKKFDPRNLLTPPTVSTAILIVMLALGLRFPGPVETVVANTGAMISPMSLIIIGVMMSENRLTAIFRTRRAYLITLLRNVVIPLIVMVILRFMPFEPDVKLCLLIYLACPCATLTTIYAIQNDMEPELAARSVLMSTLCFAATLPAVIYLGMRVM